MTDIDSNIDWRTSSFPRESVIPKATVDDPEISEQILRDARARQKLRELDRAGLQKGPRESLDADPAGPDQRFPDGVPVDPKRLTFGSKHRYAETKDEEKGTGIKVKGIYSYETRIGPQGTAERSRNVLSFVSKKKEYFLLDKVLTDGSQKDGAAYGGVEFRRSGKTESNLFRSKEVRYKADSKSYDRVSRKYFGGLIGESFNYDDKGRKTLSGESTIGYSWSKDKEPGGLVTRAESRQFFGFASSTRRSFDHTTKPTLDGKNETTTESILINRNIGPYRMARTTADDGVGQLKTQQIGSGKLFSRTTHYDPTTNEKIVHTKALFGLINKRGEPTPMSVDEIKQDQSWGRLQTKAQTAKHDVAEQLNARVKMVEAATLYALPEPGTTRRLQDRTGTPQREFSRSETISQEKFNAIGAWVDSDGAKPYAKALVEEEIKVETKKAVQEQADLKKAMQDRQKKWDKTRSDKGSEHSGMSADAPTQASRSDNGSNQSGMTVDAPTRASRSDNGSNQSGMTVDAPTQASRSDSGSNQSGMTVDAPTQASRSDNGSKYSGMTVDAPTQTDNQSDRSRSGTKPVSSDKVNIWEGEGGGSGSETAGEKITPIPSKGKTNNLHARSRSSRVSQRGE